MKMMAYRHPWMFRAFDREVVTEFLMADVAPPRGVTDELSPYGLPCVWLNVDTGMEVLVRVVRDAGTASIDVSVIAHLAAQSRFIEISDVYARLGVALVTATREPAQLRVFALRIIDAVNESLGGGAPVAELTLRV